MKKKPLMEIANKSVLQSGFYKDPNVMGVLCKGLEEGRDLKTCCESVGISKPLYDKALKDGYRALLIPYAERTEEDNALAEFYCQAKQAVAKFEEEAIHTILKASKYGDWKAAAWLLERRLPEVYGKRELPPLQAEADNRATSIRVEIVDAKSSDNDERLKSLEAEVRKELGKEDKEAIDMQGGDPE